MLLLAPLSASGVLAVLRALLGAFGSLIAFAGTHQRLWHLSGDNVIVRGLRLLDMLLLAPVSAFGVLAVADASFGSSECFLGTRQHLRCLLVP